ncbi:MAG: hypothetical protein PHG85_04545 [Candidatus Altiarchaeota archaeon]|nr:hypothetical protein [Candidatus Altiarchaeota archaeon]
MASEWHAAEALNEALGRTNELLFRKIRPGFWLKLAFVVFLIGGSGGFNPMTWAEPDKNSGDTDIIATLSPYLPYIVIGLAVLLVISLVFSFIRAVCQFMLIESVATGEVELIKGFKRNIDSGFNLFLFNLAFGLLTLFALAIIAAPAIFLFMNDSANFQGIKLIATLAVTIATAVLFLICSGFVSSFTNDFAIAFVYSERRGVLDGWRRLWALIKGNAKQFIVYIVVKVAVGIIAGIASMIIGLVILVISLLILAAFALGAGLIVAGIAVALNIDKSALMILVIPAVLIAIAYFIAVGYLTILLTLPIPVFFRNYSLLFLQRIEPSIRIIGIKGREKGKPAEKELNGESKSENVETQDKKERPKGRKKKAGELRVY